MKHHICLHADSRRMFRSYISSQPNVLFYLKWQIWAYPEGVWICAIVTQSELRKQSEKSSTTFCFMFCLNVPEWQWCHLICYTIVKSRAKYLHIYCTLRVLYFIHVPQRMILNDFGDLMIKFTDLSNKIRDNSSVMIHWHLIYGYLMFTSNEPQWFWRFSRPLLQQCVCVQLRLWLTSDSFCYFPSVSLSFPLISLCLWIRFIKPQDTWILSLKLKHVQHTLTLPCVNLRRPQGKFV